MACGQPAHVLAELRAAGYDVLVRRGALIIQRRDGAPTDHTHLAVAHALSHQKELVAFLVARARAEKEEAALVRKAAGKTKSTVRSRARQKVYVR